MLLHYYGNSEKYTGNWCFGDQCLTFRDIASLYMKHARCRTLTIISDCHSSGNWVSECAKFLNEQEVKPCGHSAKEKLILLKVYASCCTGQDAKQLRHTPRCLSLGDGDLLYICRNGTYLGQQQNTFSADFTRVRCGKEENEECTIPAHSDWLSEQQKPSNDENYNVAL